MTQQYNATVTTVQSGHTLSNEINLKGMRTLGVFFPAITSCQAFFQVAPGLTSPASATYVRMHSNYVASVQAFNVGPGSCAIVIDVDCLPFAYGRIETAVSQAALITFTVVGKY